MRKIFEHVTFYYSIFNNRKNLKEFFSNFEKNFYQINDFFNIEYPTIKIYLVSKNKIDKFVKKTSAQYKTVDIPKWLDGFSTSENIHIVTPTSLNVSEMVSVALHEATHFITYQLDLKQPPLKLLDEGLAVFLSKQNQKKAFNLIVNEYLKNELKDLSDFCTYDSIQFSKLKGYQYSYYITEFLLLNYGKKLYIDWIKQPELFLKEIFHLNLEFKNYITPKINIAIEKNP